MKRHAFTISLVANAFLICAFAGALHRSPAVKYIPTPAASPRYSEPTPTAAPAQSPPPTNMAQLIRQLHGANVSPELLARMAAADFDEKWNLRERDMEARYNRGDISETDLTRFNFLRDLEEEKELRAELGDDGFKQWDEKRQLQDFTSLDLTAKEADALYQLKKDLQRQQFDLTQKIQDGEIDNADASDLQADAEKKYQAQAETLLGDTRYAEAMNPDSETGDLRRNLRAMGANESQTTAMLSAEQQFSQAQAKLNQQLQDGTLSDSDYDQQINSITAARDKQYQQTLGADGWTALQEQQDNRYQTMKQFASLWQLNDTDINTLYRQLQSYDQRVVDYQKRAQAMADAGQNVDWNQVQQNVQQFAQQTEQSLQQYLGNDRFQQMKRNGIFNLATGE